MAKRNGWNFLQLEPGTLLVASSVRRFEGLRLQQTAVNRTSLHRLRAPSHSTSLLLNSMRTRVLFVEGHSLTADCCLVLNGGVEVELTAHAGSSWLLITLAGNEMRAVTPHSIGAPMPLRPDVRIIEGSTTACIALVREAIEALRAGPCGVAAAHARTLAISMLQESTPHGAPASSCGSIPDARARRGCAVERARKYIRDHLAEPIRLSDLCARAFLQARSLEYGFRELVGLAPMGYVRMLRLAQVRMQLLEDLSATRSISDIALDAGFSHLSQFVVDYRRVFGETPSATRRTVMASAGSTTERRRNRARMSQSLNATLWPKSGGIALCATG